MLDSEQPNIQIKLAAALSNPELLRAGSALQNNDIAVAERLLKAHLFRDPFDVAAIRMLAETAARLGRYEDAEKLLRRTLELEPEFYRARVNYATVLLKRSKFTDALVAIDHMLRLKPSDAEVLTLKAAASARIGRYEEAITAYRNVLGKFPDQPQLWVSLGHVLKTVGLQVDCVAAYRRATNSQGVLGDAWWSLANLKTIRLTSDDIASMSAALSRATARVDRYHLHFALGKALEDMHDYALSFSHYAEGNTLRRAELPYDANETAHQLGRIQRLMQPEVFDSRAANGCAAPDPIFIVGLPRSGSTLIEQILASHTMVEGTMELPDILAMSSDLADKNVVTDGNAESLEDYIPSLLELDPEGLRMLGERYLDQTRAHRQTQRPYFIDKMPNNFAHIGLIHLILPNAKIIDARRHPMATGFSCYKQHFARGQGFTYSLEDIGRYYRDYRMLMNHYDSVLPGRVYRVVYEDLVEDPDAEIRALLAHCGLPFEPECLNFHLNTRAVRTASSEQVRLPISRDAIAHWRKFEPWLGPLRQSLGDFLDSAS